MCIDALMYMQESENSIVCSLPVAPLLCLWIVVWICVQPKFTTYTTHIRILKRRNAIIWRSKHVEISSETESRGAVSDCLVCLVSSLVSCLVCLLSDRVCAASILPSCHWFVIVWHLEKFYLVQRKSLFELWSDFEALTQIDNRKKDTSYVVTSIFILKLALSLSKYVFKLLF